MKKIIEFISIVVAMVAIIFGVLEFGQLENLQSVANLVNVFADVGWFIVSFVIATLCTAFLVVVANISVIIRFMAIPAWLVFSLSLLVTVDQLMGYSYPAVPPQSKVIAYHIIKNADNSRTIEAWMYLKKEGRARAYNFPYTEEREEALKQGWQGAQKGEPVEVDLSKGRSGEQDGQKPESMVIYEWDLDADYPGKPQTSGSESGLIIQDIPDMPDDGNVYQQMPDGTIEVVDPAIVPQTNNWKGIGKGRRGRGGEHEDFDRSFHGGFGYITDEELPGP